MYMFVGNTLVSILISTVLSFSGKFRRVTAAKLRLCYSKTLWLLVRLEGLGGSQERSCV